MARFLREARLFLFAFTIRRLSSNIDAVRILHISSAKTYGGGEKHFVDLCRGLAGRGHDVFAALRPTNEWQTRLDFLPPENILPVSLRNSFGVLSATRIAEFIRENRIEIVHAHVARDYIPASLACRMAKTAEFVLTRHVLFPLKAVHRFTLTNLAKAVAVSKPVEANLQSVFTKEKVVLVSNGIDVGAFQNADRAKLRREFRLAHDVPHDAFLIGTVGELKVLKGQRDFILAAQIVAQKYPQARFIIVGKDHSFKQDFRRELKRLVKIFRMEEKFLWLEWAEDTASLLSALDVFVSASHLESFGLAILEAMAIGCPIVATGTEGANELLQTGVSGKLVPVKEPVRLAAAIDEFLGDEESCRRHGENAQTRAGEKFGLERMIGETEKLYQEVLRRKTQK